MPLKVAQAWSGHTTLSVLLDAYYGVMQHDEHVAYQRVEDALARPARRRPRRAHLDAAAR